MVDIIQRNNVSVTGCGDQTMIFAHGFGCNQNVWLPVIQALESDFRCVLFDYVGAGNSDLSAYDKHKYATLDGYAKDVLDICEALAIEAPVFVGHSVSAMIGVRAALLKPGYFSKMIFVSPSPYYINDGEYIGGMEESDLLDLLSMMDNNYLGWSSAIAPLVMGNADKPELGEALTANFCSTDPNIAKEFARVTFLSDSRPDLQKLEVPNFTLQCSDDMLAPLAVGNYIYKHTANNTLTILEATGHCPHLSAPQETIEAIKSYVSVPLMEYC
ncbi:alpha/beta fold hydrolase [Mucilaginibacter polytrichastri]|uniref:Sigma factor sigB regulation protein rsbQ n=1 Tax=Mucilaginibacter polytrichastri TaxID=1302689 RepID=A0A1Q6A0D7_9SPHI|nr:alpha/beta hydrolase [Mucilaginibacter polytrichastri]OKS87480.1 Sigma factor sigB regulation protein rsbQ [Mucilaginibacter polytrichastri]SFS91160.1 Pimeloyl-ACP methyl ester carboxylesterase [Mucilaginibacter polytrichastri]